MNPRTNNIWDDETDDVVLSCYQMSVTSSNSSRPFSISLRMLQSCGVNTTSTASYSKSFPVVNSILLNLLSATSLEWVAADC